MSNLRPRSPPHWPLPDAVVQSPDAPRGQDDVGQILELYPETYFSAHAPADVTEVSQSDWI